MSFFATIKRNAKLALRGHWGTAIAVNLLVSSIMLALALLEQMALRVFVIDPLMQNPTMEPINLDLATLTRELLAVGWVELIITTVFMLLSALLLSPLYLGLTRWFYSLVRQESPGFGELFRFFETPRRYFRALWYTIQINLRCWLWGIVFFAVPFGLFGVCARFWVIPDISRETRSIATAGAMFAMALIILAAIFYIIYIAKYILAAYLLCEGDNIGAREAIRLSARCTKGHRVTITLFSFSFLGWYLLSPLTAFLLLLYIAPYYMAGLALMARYLAEKGLPPKDTQEFQREYHV